MKISELNHVAIHTQDVERSSQFYRRMLLLEPIERPAFSFPGAWFRLGASQELHIIGRREEPVFSNHRGNHFALRVDSLEEWENHLASLGVPLPARRVRPDGVLQLFIRDPDGHVVELFSGP